VKRLALRALITSALPPAWRYFGVNHYREISAMIPDEFFDRMRACEHLRPSNVSACDTGDILCESPD
jgi:hypothetical protein